MRVKHLAEITANQSAGGGTAALAVQRGLFPIGWELATLARGRGRRPALTLPLDQLMHGSGQLTTSQVHTHVAAEVERGEHGTATRAQLFGREGERHTAIHGVLLGLQQIEAHLSVVIGRRRGSNRQVLEERATQAQTRAMHPRLHRGLLQPEDPGHVRGRELGDVGEHQRQANVRWELSESLRNSAFSVLPEMLVERAFSRGRKGHHGIRR